MKYYLYSFCVCSFSTTGQNHDCSHYGTQYQWFTNQLPRYSDFLALGCLDFLTELGTAQPIACEKRASLQELADDVMQMSYFVQNNSLGDDNILYFE